MSLSSDSVALRHKRTATERALNNADPLIVKKKARQADVTVAKPNNGPKVSHFFMLPEILLRNSIQMTNLGRRASVRMQGDDDLPSEVGPIAPTKSGMASSDTQDNTVQMSAPSVSWIFFLYQPFLILSK